MTPTAQQIVVVGVDPGFASLGYAVVRLGASAGDDEVVRLGVFHTEKSSKKANVLASDDNFRRARELAGDMRRLLLGPNTRDARVLAICAESMSFPRQSSVAAKVAMSWGVLAALCEWGEIPLAQASPQQVKKALCASKSASKVEVEAALTARYTLSGESLAGVKPADREHAFDALGAVVACLDSEVVRMARRLVS